MAHPQFTFRQADLLDRKSLAEAMEGAELVVHFAANADVRFGTEHPRKDLDQNTIATWNVLEAMREQGCKRIVFSSTGSVYGEPEIFPTPETCPFPVQTSLYGASKLAAEGLIQAYCEGFGLQGYIFRFVSILGERYSHGHVFDFYRQLSEHPEHLHVLGNGHQRKSYLYVQDCIDAILTALEKADGKVNIFNLGTDEYCEVNDSIGWICEHLGLHPKLDIFRRRTRLGRGQSVYSARLLAHPRLGLAAAIDHQASGFGYDQIRKHRHCRGESGVMKSGVDTLYLPATRESIV